MTVSSTRAGELATQAAGEYVGILLSGAGRAIRNGADSAGRFLEGHPVEVIIAAVVLLLLLRLLRRR